MGLSFSERIGLQWANMKWATDFSVFKAEFREKKKVCRVRSFKNVCRFDFLQIEILQLPSNL
jgi:hypothetical protein